MRKYRFIFSISSTIYSFLNDDSDSNYHIKKKKYLVYINKKD